MERTGRVLSGINTLQKNADGFLFEYPEKAFDLLLLDIEMDGVSGTHQESLLVSDGGYLTHVELSDIIY